MCVSSDPGVYVQGSFLEYVAALVKILYIHNAPLSTQNTQFKNENKKQ